MRNETFHLTIPGKPIAWARPRLGKEGQFYNTKRSQKHRDLIGWLAREVLGGRDAPLFTGPVQVNLIFDFGAEPKTIIEVKPIFPESECYIGKTDIDNLAKMCIEAISSYTVHKGGYMRRVPGIVLADDSQVCRMEAIKIRG